MAKGAAEDAAIYVGIWVVLIVAIWLIAPWFHSEGRVAVALVGLIMCPVIAYLGAMQGFDAAEAPFRWEREMAQAEARRKEDAELDGRSREYVDPTTPYDSEGEAILSRVVTLKPRRGADGD